jgi:hypothetical protein
MGSADCAIEFHGSILSGVATEDGRVSMHFSKACVLAEEQGWLQEVELIVHDARKLEQPGSYPLRVSEGEICMEDADLSDLLEVPFAMSGACTVLMLFDNAESLEVHGKDPELRLIGEREYLDKAEKP